MKKRLLEKDEVLFPHSSSKTEPSSYLPQISCKEAIRFSKEIHGKKSAPDNALLLGIHLLGKHISHIDACPAKTHPELIEDVRELF